MLLPHPFSEVVRRAPPTLAPPGTVIDYNSPDNIGIRLLVATWVTLVAALFAIAFRLSNKLFFARSKLAWDDYFSIFAFLFAIARAGCNCWEVWKAGVGRHVWDIRPRYYHPILNVYEIGNVVYLFGIMCAKLSFLFLYLNIFGKPNQKFRWICYAVGSIVVGYCVSCALATLFACRPEAATWNRNIKGQCISLESLDISVGGLNILTDIIVFLLPIPILVRLQIPLARKAELLVVFGTGLFVIATTVIRVVIVIRTLKDFDQTRAIIPDMIWLTVELNVGIFCGCIPLMRPIIRYFAESRLFSFSKSSLSRLVSSDHKRSSKVRRSNDDSSSNNDVDIYTTRDKTQVQPT